jgi:phosphatidylserine synthase
LADLATVQYWRKRTRSCEVAFIASIVLIVLLYAFVAIRENPYWLFVLPVATALAGMYCWSKEYRAFLDYELSNGASKEEAQVKWNQKYPMAD